MKKFALLLIIFFGVSGVIHASTITFSETIQNGILVGGSRIYDYLETTDAKYRAVAYHYNYDKNNNGSWQPGGFNILNGTFDSPSLYLPYWLYWQTKGYQGFYIEKIDGGLFDLISMEIVVDMPGSGDKGGVAVTTGISPGDAFATDIWTAYKVSGLNNIVPPGPHIKPISFGDDFIGVSRVYLDGGYPLFSNETDVLKGALWDNIVLAENNSNPVPEPTTILLLSTGLIGLAGWGRKRFKKD